MIEFSQLTPDKVNNGGTTAQGRVSAEEWNALVQQTIDNVSEIGDLVTPPEVVQAILDNTASEVTPDGVQPVSGAAVYSIDVRSRTNEHGLALVNANANGSIVAEAVPFIYSNGSITTSSAAVQGYLIPVEGGVTYYNNSAYSFSNVVYLKDRPDINEAYLSNKGYVDIGQQILPPDDCAYLLINSAPSRLITVTKRGELISTLGGVREVVQNLQQTIEGIIWERDFVVKNGSSLSQVFPNPEGRGAFTVKLDGECITEYSVYYCAQPNMVNAVLIKKIPVGRALTVQVKEQYPYVGIYAIPSKVGNLRLTMSTSAKRTSIMNMICFGDSLTENVDKYGYHYSDYIQEFLGCDVCNVGIGGTRLAMRANIGAGEIYAALDMPYLIKSWCDNDYTNVDSAVEYIKTNLSDDNTTIIERLKSIRPTDVDIVTIFGGVNDYMSGSNIGDADSTSMLDVNGGINTIVSNLLTANPALQIYIFTPTVMYSNNSRTDENWCDNYISTNGGMAGKKLSDVVEVVKAAAKRNHIPCKDMYWELGWNKANFATYFTTPTDSVHPFGGFEWIGRVMSNYISAH